MKKLKSEYHHRFWFRVAEATRTGWACLLVSALLVYAPKFTNFFSVPVLAPVLAVLLAGPPLGTVLQNSWGLLTVAVPALLSTIAVLHVLSPPISIVVAIACTGVSSCLIAYLSETHILGRKISLAQVSIVYISAHYTPDMNVVTFPLKMLAPNCVGIVMAIIATLFPIPRLAVWEVKEGAKSCVRGSSELLRALVKTIMAPDSSTFGSMHLHSKVLAKASAETIADLKIKQADIWWELGACGARHKFKRFTKSLDCLNLYLTGMEIALECGYVLDTPASLRGTLQGTFGKVIEECNSLLEFAVKGLRLSTASIDGRSRQKVIEEGKEMLNLFDTSYRAAREQAYYTLSKTSSVHEKETEYLEPWQEYRTSSSLPDVNFIKRRFRGRVSMLFFIFNLRLYLMETINLVAAGHSSANKMHQLARIGPSVASLEQTIQDQTNKTKLASKVDSQMPPSNSSGPVFLAPDDPSVTASRRLSSRRVSSDPVIRMGSRQSSQGSTRLPGSVFLDPDDPAMSGSRRGFSGPTYSNPVSRQSSHGGAIFSEACLPEAPAQEIKEESRESNMTNPGLSLGDVKQGSSLRQCSHRNAGARETIIKASGGGIDTSTWRKILTKLGLKPSKTQTKRSFKTALEMVLATFFGFLVLRGKSQVFWAPVTVGFIIGNFQGGSWRISNLRLQGTVLGSIYGFLALSASHNYRWAILLLLTPWVIFASFIRYSPAYGYSGLVAAFTAAILMLGGFQYDIKSAAMDRITETFVGILCFVFVETVIFPERAVVLVRRELVSSLVSLRDCVGAIVSVYTEPRLQDCPHCRSLAVVEIKHLERLLRASFAKQTVLSKEAALEPDLWFVPFPAEVYSKIIAIQGRMLDLLFFMVCSLHATTEDCASEQMETLLKPLRTSLTAMQEEVLASIDFFQEVLQAKPVQGSKPHRLWRWIGCRARARAGGDVEQQQQPQPASPNHPHHPLLVLGRRHRSVDGIPTNLKTIMDNFERSFEEVFEDLIATTKADGAKQILGNTVMTSIGSLTFSLHALLRETVHLEKAIHELLQAESPWSVLDFWDTYEKGVFHNPSVGGKAVSYGN